MPTYADYLQMTINEEETCAVYVTERTSELQTEVLILRI